ncbi:MAG: tetratricopeptide repeat protein [Acidobacteriota bacterium]
MLAHLPDCPGCCEVAAQALKELQAAEDGLKILRFGLPKAKRRPPEEPVARDRTWWTPPRATGRELAEGEELLEELLGAAELKRTFLVRNDERFHSPALAELILEEARETSFEDAFVGSRLVALGLLVLDHLDPHYFGQRSLDDLRGRGHAYRGNILRLCRDYDAAEEAFARSAELLVGSRNELEDTARLHFLALLRKSQGRFDEAARDLHEVCQRYESLGEDCRAARAYSALGDILFRQGRPEEAVQPLAEALVRIDPEEDPRTLLYVRHNLVVCLAELGRYREAEELFERCQNDYARFPDATTMVHADWVKGMLAAGLGREDEAEELFQSVRDRFLERDLPYDAAIASLDLAMLYSRQGRTAELKTLARTMTTVIAAYGNVRETTTALMFFTTAVEQEKASVQVIERVARFLRQAHVDPNLRFRDSST